MFFGIQWFVEISGLASGETGPTGWIWGIVATALVAYAVGIMLMGTGGILLKDLFKREMPAI